MGLLSQDISKIAFKEPLRIGGGSVEYMYATHVDDNFIYLRTYNDFIVHDFNRVLENSCEYNTNIFDFSKSSPHILVEITSHDGSSDMTKIFQLHFEYGAKILFEGRVWFYSNDESRFYNIPFFSKYQVCVQAQSIYELDLNSPLVCIENVARLPKTNNESIVLDNTQINCGILDLKLKHGLEISCDSKIRSGVVLCEDGMYLKQAFRVFDKYIYNKKNIVEYKKNNKLFDLMNSIDSNLFIFSDIKSECLLVFEKLSNGNPTDFINNFQIIGELMIDYKPLNTLYRVNLVKDYLYSENYKLEKTIKQEVQKRAPSFGEYLKNISLKNL